ncbi:MAG: hypothetical protein ACYDCC_09330 [Actinomycetota bacterium]
MQVYLPDDLYKQVKKRKLPASELLQEAIRREVKRRDLEKEADKYFAELQAEVGDPLPEDIARAKEFVRGLRKPRKRRAG